MIAGARFVAQCVSRTVIRRNHCVEAAMIVEIAYRQFSPCDRFVIHRLTLVNPPTNFFPLFRASIMGSR